MQSRHALASYADNEYSKAVAADDLGNGSQSYSLGGWLTAAAQTSMNSHTPQKPLHLHLQASAVPLPTSQVVKPVAHGVQAA